MFFIVITANTIRAQDWNAMDVKEIDELSFDQLQNLDLLQVASKKPLSKKDVPGVVTLIKREEIELSGARDLIDILRMVPGFEFGSDIQGVVGIGTRGNWAHEGKALIMIDGLQINDFLFGTVPLSNRIPVDQIERIEIIRGPGSSFYGGFAELTVINIITRAASDLNGARVSGNLGRMQQAFGSLNSTMMFGKKFGNVEVGISAFIGRANISDRTYTGLDGVSFPLADVNTMMPININANIQTGNFHARVLYDRYFTTMRTGIGNSLPQLFSTNFTSILADTRYDWKLSEQITLSPRISYTYQKPWNLIDDAAINPSSAFNFLIVDKTVERLLGSVTISADISQYLFFTLGMEYYIDNGTASSLDPLFSLWLDDHGSRTRTIQYNNLGVFLQSLITTDIININMGLRLDKHSAVQLAVVPWIGITKTIGKFNFKALFGQNFRAPSIENIRLNPRIKPELTTALELELGYQFQYNMFVSANIFDVAIKDAIIFGGGGYINYAQTHTRGLELEYFFKDTWGNVNVSYSFYIADDSGLSDSIRSQNPYRVWSYRTSIQGKRELTFSDDNVLMGFAPHKITINSSFNLSKNITGLSIAPSLIWLSSRYGLSEFKFYEGIQRVQKIEPTLLLNIFINYKDALGIEGFNVGLGMYNILNEKYDFVQPYNAGNGLLPGPSREIILKASYHLRF